MKFFTSLLAASCMYMSSPAHADCFDDAASFHGVNPWILRGITSVESHFNPYAINRNSNHTIDMGATQVNSVHFPELAAYGVMPNDLLDGCKSVYVGAWLLRKKVNRHGNTCAAIGAYKSENPTVRDAYVKLVQGALAAWGIALNC